MLEILEEIKTDFAIQLIYEYISIINKEKKVKTDIKQKEDLKKQLAIEIDEIYKGNNEIATKTIEKYSDIIKDYYANKKE